MAPDTPQPDDEGHLEKLQRQLYSREEPGNLQQRRDELAQPGLRRHAIATSETEPVQSTQFKDIADLRAQRRRKILIGSLLAGLVLLVFGVAVAGTMWYRMRQNVTEEHIYAAVEAPAELTAGDEISYRVVVRNDSYVDWENVEVVFEIPPGFSVVATEPELAASGRQYVRTVGQLPAAQESSFIVRGRLLGEENASVVAKAQINLTPENFPSGRFSKSALVATTITAMPLDVAIAGAPEAAQGERVLATITVTNKTAQDLQNVYVRLTPAVGMKLAPDDPQFSAGFSALDNEWMMASLPSLETVTREAIFFVEGQPGEQRVLEVEVGVEHEGQRYVQRTASAVTQISSSELTVAQQYQKAASPLVVRTGERVSGTIAFGNAGTVGLKDVVVRAQIEGAAFNPASLKLPAGAYNPTTRTITWTSASVPELALVQPGQTGEIPYEFAVRAASDFPAEEGSKNSTIVITTSVDSVDITVPVGEERKVISDRFVMSVASDVTLATDAFYDDGRLGITSTGPLPPRAGEQTTYTIRVRVGSTLNDVGDVRVVAVLPEGVQYTNQTVATVGDVQFNDRAGELVWTIPQVAGLTGRSAPTADLYFQVAVIPGEHQRGDVLPLLRTLSVTGLDLFTDTELSTEVTTYPTTESASPGKGRVE